jgi:coenzyme PQQ precursor peptide PqqA
MATITPDLLVAKGNCQFPASIFREAERAILTEAAGKSTERWHARPQGRRRSARSPKNVLQKSPTFLYHPRDRWSGRALRADWAAVGQLFFFEEGPVAWTKPEFKEVAVTLEVTAYAARR